MSRSKNITPREIEILQLIAKGKSNTQIAKDLSIALSTVKTHVEHLLSKSGCKRRLSLVVWAVRNNKLILE